MREVEKYAYLGAIDHLWMDHIDTIDDLRRVTLRAYGQGITGGVQEQAFNLFETLVDKVDEELSHRIFRIGVGVPQSEIPLNLAEKILIAPMLRDYLVTRSKLQSRVLQLSVQISLLTTHN